MISRYVVGTLYGALALMAACSDELLVEEPMGNPGAGGEAGEPPAGQDPEGIGGESGATGGSEAGAGGETAGAGGTGETEGSAGAAGEPPRGSAGAAGAMGGAGGAPAAQARCGETIDFEDGTLSGLELGPENTVLGALSNTDEIVDNYAGDVVFSTRTLRLIGLYDTPYDGAEPLGPEDGAELGPWLGEVALVPDNCAETDVTGTTVTVDFIVRLSGAIVFRPPNAAFLGSYRQGDMTFYEDAVTDSDVINTFLPQQLTHTFTAEEAEDLKQGRLFLRLYMLGGPVPIRLFIDRIVWE